jgi:ABC-2 type transport system permease protein
VTSSVIGHLIMKDWRLNRPLISLCIGVGLIALVIALYTEGAARLLGSVWFFVSLCILGSMLPASAILNERKKQTLAFVMSLPVSPVQYAIAKALSTAAMFLVPWLTLLISALILIETRHVIPHGIIPMLLILAMLPLIVFCLTSATVLVGESEGWLITVNVVCNSSYWFVWYLLARTPSLTANWRAPVAVWSSAAFIVLSAEIALIAFILVVAFFFQSRKRNFI